MNDSGNSDRNNANNTKQVANRRANQLYRAEHAQEISVRRKLYYWEHVELMRAKNREYKRRSRAAKAEQLGSEDAPAPAPAPAPTA